MSWLVKCGVPGSGCRETPRPEDESWGETTIDLSACRREWRTRILVMTAIGVAVTDEPASFDMVAGLVGDLGVPTPESSRLHETP